MLYLWQRVRRMRSEKSRQDCAWLGRVGSRWVELTWLALAWLWSGLIVGVGLARLGWVEFGLVG